jgi:P-type Ca2+ transporter type 2C
LTFLNILCEYSSYMKEDVGSGQKKSPQFYNLSAAEVCEYFEVVPNQGLTSSQASQRQQQYGQNQITNKANLTLLEILINQLKNPLISILLVVICIKIFNLIPDILAGKLGIQSVVEVLMVLAVVVITTWMGVSQEMEAEKSLEKLRNQVKFTTRVLRDSKLLNIDSQEVTVGDIIILEAGDRIPADARVIESIKGNVNEALLTGESEEVEKSSGGLKTKNPAPADQVNIVFGGTSLISGKITAIVYAIGQNTEFGKISAKLENTQVEETKFQKQTTQLLKNITILSAVAFILLEILYIFVFRYDFVNSLETGLALVIAFVPEALAAVTVIVLSISATNLVKKGVIVKNLAAAEGMGSVTTFLTDKTGTITQGKMSLDSLWFLDGHVNASEFVAKTGRDQRLLEILSFCNNSKGATELALEKFIQKHEFSVEIFDRMFEYGYSSDSKRMTVVRTHNNRRSSFSKGAGEVLLPLCDSYLDHHENVEKKLTESERQKIISKIEEYASKGLRVLLLAYRHYDDNHDLGNRENDEQKLVFTGLVCLLDPLRDEVYDTVAKFNSAGINLVMITGDHPNIAKYLAVKSGICDSHHDVISGSQLEKYMQMSALDSSTINKIYHTKVFARVMPKHKDFLVELFKSQGEIVAMAGDGINDAVAIKKANIGVAVKNAVDWVKDIAGIVVTGGFDALVDAVEEGRKIIYKARLFSHYLLSGNISQVGVFLLASIFTKYPPLSSLQLLVINLLTDTLPAVALAYEKVPGEIMKEKPEPADANLINKPIWLSIIIQGLVTSLFLFWVFWSFLPNGLIYAQTMTFLAYLCQKLYRAFTARSFTLSIFELGLFSNKITVYSVFGGVLIAYLLVWQVASYVGMTIVNWSDFSLIAALALIIPIVEEIFKFIRKNQKF